MEATLDRTSPEIAVAADPTSWARSKMLANVNRIAALAILRNEDAISSLTNARHRKLVFIRGFYPDVPHMNHAIPVGSHVLVMRN
jgi:hypothetical protein